MVRSDNLDAVGPYGHGQGLAVGRAQLRMRRKGHSRECFTALLDTVFHHTPSPRPDLFSQIGRYLRGPSRSLCRNYRGHCRNGVDLYSPHQDATQGLKRDKSLFVNMPFPHLFSGRVFPERVTPRDGFPQLLHLRICVNTVDTLLMRQRNSLVTLLNTYADVSVVIYASGSGSVFAPG